MAILPFYRSPKGPYIATVLPSLPTVLPKEKSLNRSQRDRTLQPMQRAGCRLQSVSIGPKGTVHCNHVDYLLMTQRPELSQSVPKGPYIATMMTGPGAAINMETVSIGPKGTVHCNTSWYRTGSTKPIKGLNRSQRDRTLQLKGDNVRVGIDVSIGPKGTVHCNAAVAISRRSGKAGREVSIGPKGTVYCNGDSPGRIRLCCTKVSIGPKGTVHCNAFAKCPDVFDRFYVSQSVPKGPYIAT